VVYFILTVQTCLAESERGCEDLISCSTDFVDNHFAIHNTCSDEF